MNHRRVRNIFAALAALGVVTAAAASAYAIFVP